MSEDQDDMKAQLARIHGHLRDIEQGDRCGPYPQGYDAWRDTLDDIEEHIHHMADRLIAIGLQARALFPDEDPETLAGAYNDNLDLISNVLGMVQPKPEDEL